MKRIFSIDFTRGIVMIIMALDHVRDLMHINAGTQSPTDLATTTPILFFTRWITYLCAPIFIFLAGTSACISFKNKNDVSKSRKYLFKRGLWLIVLEFTIVNLGLFFDPGFHTLIFEVIAAIGFGFIILSLVLKLSYRAIGIIGFIVVFCHGFLPVIPFAEGSMVKTILSPLFAPGAFPVLSNRVFIMAYPPVPWLGIMMLGFASAKLFELPEEGRNRLFLKTGAAALALFVLLRCINIYGDPVLWSTQKTAIYSLLSFMNITKYPPSLLFCLATLGIMFLILAVTERPGNKAMKIVSVYGRVPLFYFIAHFYIIHCLLVILLFWQGFHWGDLNFASGAFGRPKGVKSGVSLGIVYLIWITIVVTLYKPCAWFGKYKAEHQDWWLSYM